MEDLLMKIRIRRWLTNFLLTANGDQDDYEFFAVNNAISALESL